MQQAVMQQDMVQQERRVYSSPVREARAAATRRKILEAVVEVLADGVGELTVPAVAQRAGVSVGTVYRHFSDKSGLVEALPGYVAERIGLRPPTPVSTWEELDEVIRALYRRMAQADELLVAALASSVARQASDRTVAARMVAFRQSFSAIAPDLAGESIERAAQLAFLLTSSQAVWRWRQQLDMDADQAADTVMWALRRMLGGTR